MYLSHNGTTGAYDDQDRLLTYGDYAYTYTANGELLTKTDTATSETTAYVYDALGNLLAVTLPDGTLIEYLIDGQNRRVGKKVNSVLTKSWLYHNSLKPFAELDGSGNLIALFVYGTSPLTPDYIFIRATGTRLRVVSDHLGSPRLVVNEATGAIVQRMDFDEFGNVLQDTNPGFQPFWVCRGHYDSLIDRIPDIYIFILTVQICIIYLKHAIYLPSY